ncbi:hypothetical protein [Kitasatospora sp. NPDC088346]|uniref:hypothetical protein n=1 Tax=Kitasatospora sp. NPDC088346 TaxID=3364073 RepID=UPI00381B182A
MSEVLDEADPGSGTPPAAPARSGSAQRSRRRRGPDRRARIVAAVVAATAVLGAGLWSVPSTREVLLQSFTEQPSGFAELYFTSAPSFDGGTVIVPVALNDRGTGTKSYQVRVVLESPRGEAVASTVLTLEPHEGAPVPAVARVQTKAEVGMVRVSLVGHPQKLHFRFGKPQAPGTGAHE